MNVLNLELIVFIIFAIIAILSSIIVIEHKSLVYAASFLAILGISNAVLFILLGYTLVALFHLAVYVGAAVTFILFSITMLKEAPLTDIPTRVLAMIFTIFILATFTIILINGVYVNIPTPSFIVSYKALANALITKFWFPLLIASLALIVTLIEAITLARREVGI
ncbi:MAG: NADH-quinone oxidoreductase subunit J [Nitrososphaerales archaeon]